MEIFVYRDSAHRENVIALWQDVFSYTSPQSRPELVIDKKIAEGDGLFFVMVNQDVLTGTIMAGYDGHRGWLYSLCVAIDQQRAGVGTALVKHAEKALRNLGCVKINLQVLPGNDSAISFYKKLGYLTEERISMAKLLSENLSL